MPGEPDKLCQWQGCYFPVTHQCIVKNDLKNDQFKVDKLHSVSLAINHEYFSQTFLKSGGKYIYSQLLSQVASQMKHHLIGSSTN